MAILIKQLQQMLQKRCEEYVMEPAGTGDRKAIAKTELMQSRNADIIRVHAKGSIQSGFDRGEDQEIRYKVHWQYLIKQEELMYLEEEIECREAVFRKGELVSDEGIPKPELAESVEEKPTSAPEMRAPFVYDRLQAVKYADTWWNEYNPAYQSFENDCTNYISQCLRAGGAPMRGQPNRSRGWWYSGDVWSYSWSVAHALNLYLQNSVEGLRTREVSSPEELLLGDIICYDFEGDGRFNHNTIVTAKDYNGMPLVNAHTYDSRHRYWSYLDSSAYTPKIQYKFYTIVDDA